jgi:hypothetical protein
MLNTETPFSKENSQVSTDTSLPIWCHILEDHTIIISLHVIIFDAVKYSNKCGLKSRNFCLGGEVKAGCRWWKGGPGRDPSLDGTISAK